MISSHQIRLRTGLPKC